MQKHAIHATSACRTVYRPEPVRAEDAFAENPMLAVGAGQGGTDAGGCIRASDKRGFVRSFVEMEDKTQRT